MNGTYSTLGDKISTCRIKIGNYHGKEGTLEIK